MSPRRSFGSPCNAACACPSATTTQHAACAVKSWTIGPTTPSAVAVAAIGSFRHNAIRNVVCSAVPEFTSISPELEQPGLLLPERPRTRVVLTLSSILASTPLPQLAVDADPRTSGSPGVCRGSGFLGFIFAPHLPHSSATPSVADVFHEVETRKRAFQDTASQVPPSARSSWRRAGEGGPRPCGKWLLGSPPSPAPRVASPWACPGIPASGLHSASAAPFTGKTRVQSSGGLYWAGWRPG